MGRRMSYSLSPWTLSSITARLALSLACRSSLIVMRPSSTSRPTQRRRAAPSARGGPLSYGLADQRLLLQVQPGAVGRSGGTLLRLHLGGRLRLGLRERRALQIRTVAGLASRLR